LIVVKKGIFLAYTTGICFDRIASFFTGIGLGIVSAQNGQKAGQVTELKAPR